MTGGLFPFIDEPLSIDPGAMLLPRFARDAAPVLLAQIAAIAAAAPFRHLTVPGGRRMSVAMTAAGAVGWTSDPRGYRYDTVDPASGRPWPAIPPAFQALAEQAAAAAGFVAFHPDSCLVNRYAPGARMGLHQDRDEADMGQPIVSVSLGLPATFLWAGARRAGGARRIPLDHGDAVVWGGPARLAFHGIAPLAAGHHSETAAFRYNLTFRRAR